MADEKALAVSLEEFGLSKYEALAYVTLMARGTTSAGDLAYYSEIPRTKIYPTLVKLQNKSLAMVSKSRPIMCTAIAPEDAFDDIIHEQINKVDAMNTLVSGLKRVSEESRKARGLEEKRYVHLGANVILDQLRSMIGGARTSISVTVDRWGLGLLVECKSQLLSALMKGLDLRIMLPFEHVCSKEYKNIPNGIQIKAFDVAQNCFVFDETEVLLVDNTNGKGAVFSSSEILGANQSNAFTSIWQRDAMNVEPLSDMTKSEAQDICNMIKIVQKTGLAQTLISTIQATSKTKKIDFIELLEKQDIDIRTRTLDDIIEMMDAAMQITCLGHVGLESGGRSIAVESSKNDGCSLPWVSILDGYLQGHGYITRIVFRQGATKEKTHISISKR